jgi:NADH:ubiquinone oxidoreductase subunit
MYVLISNPDVTQYTPIFNNQAGWQLYHGEGYSKATPFKFDQWHHVKIDVHGRQAEIYIDDMQKPLIKATEQKRDPKAGSIGLQAGGIPTRCANLQYTIRQPVAQPQSTNATKSQPLTNECRYKGVGRLALDFFTSP